MRAAPAACPAVLLRCAVLALLAPGVVAPRRNPQWSLVNVVASYEATTRRRLRRPVWQAARDPLANQPARQVVRGRAVMQIWGSVAEVWTDICHNLGRGRFIPSFLAYLTYV